MNPGWTEEFGRTVSKIIMQNPALKQISIFRVREADAEPGNKLTLINQLFNV